MTSTQLTAGIAVDPALARCLASEAGGALIRRIGTDLVPAMAGVNTGRRRLLRASQLIAGNRSVAPPDAGLVAAAVADWGRALDLISAYAAVLDRTGLAAVDELFGQLDDPTSPAREICRLVATTGMGFSGAEFDWALAELQAAAFEPMRVIFDDDPDSLRATCASAFAGDNGLLQIGFVDLGSDPGVTAQVRAAFVRARRAGVTLSVLLVLPAMVLSTAALSTSANPIRDTAATVAAGHAVFRASAG